MTASRNGIVAGALCSMALAGLVTLYAQSAGDAALLTSPKYGTWGFDLSGMDRAVKPGDDFFRYADGAWFDRTEIPADRARYGNFDKLAELSENRLRAILEDVSKGTVKDPDASRIAAAYAAYMNEPLAERLDATPIQPELAEIRKIQTRDQMTALMGKANTTAFTSILPVGVTIDAKAPTKYAVMAVTGGLGLPDRDYYLQSSFAMQKSKYEEYVSALLTMIGWDKPAENARAIVAFETRLAQDTWTRAERRDRDKTYNPMTPAELARATPGFDWPRYLAASKLASVTRIIVTTNTSFPKFAAIYTDTTLDTLKAWQAFHVADTAAPYLSKRFVDAEFEFRRKTLNGQPEQRPRWKRAGTFLDDTLGEAVGRIYVARYFPPASKAKMDALVVDIRTALDARIRALTWMGPETKARALQKLAAFTVKIGYPLKWRDYTKLTMSATELYGNRLRSAGYEWQRDLDRLNSPVDKAEWGMTPQTVNAYYNPPNNEIVFPAAILQAPFFDPDADAAINYGGIGAVIGHEISHGFDDQGRKSDGDGTLRDWWTADDAAKFNAQAARLGAQYSAFEPLAGAHINGQLTMGENIGDMGGLSLAFDAYHAHLKGATAPVLDGFTGDQRVFLGWAQVWRERIRDDAVRQRLVSDSHSPARFRVDGTIRNVDGWYTAFDVKPGDKLYVAPADRVRIW